MSTRQSTCAAFAVALGFAVAAVSCGGSDDSTTKPVQDVTFLMVNGGGDTKAAFGWNKDSGWNVAQVRATDKVNMAFTGSTAGSGSFSGALATGGAFTGDVGGSVTFTADFGNSGTFSGSAVLTASCSVDDLCEFAEALCSDFAAAAQDGSNACAQETVSECDSEVSSADFKSAIEKAGGGDAQIEAIICAVIDFFGCLGRNAADLQNLSDAVVESCADSAGLAALGSDLGGNGNNNN